MIIPDEHLKQIGRICVSFSGLEFRVAFLLCNLIGANPKVGEAITSEMSFSKMVDLLSSLGKIKIKDDNLLDELKTYVKKLNELNIRRNQIIHSFWGKQIAPKNNDDLISRMKTTAKQKYGLKHTEEKMAEKDIKQIADGIIECAEGLTKYTVKLASQ